MAEVPPAQNMGSVFKDVDFGDVQIPTDGSDAVIPGQELDSPPNTGQKSDSPTDTSLEDNADLKTEPEDKDKVADKVADADKPLPYDQDPKWIAARDAQKTLTSLLEDNGFLDVDDLKDALNSGKSLKELLGDKDAATLISKSKELADLKQQRLDDEADSRRENETIDEKAERMERENQELRDRLDGKERDEAESARNREDLENYDRQVERVLDVKGADLDDTGKELVRTIMGIDNPAIDVDIKDVQGIRSTSMNMVNKITEYIKAIRQNAIDEYANGKSDLSVNTPTKTDVNSSNTTPKKNYDLNEMTDDQVLDSGKEELYEVFEKGLNAMS